MKLGVIDYQYPRGGAERFVLSVLDSMPEDIEITVTTAGAALDGYRELAAKSRRPITLVEHKVVMHQSALVDANQAVLSGPQIYDVPASLWEEPDLVWCPWINRLLLQRKCYSKTVATIHDMIIVELGEFMAEKREPVGRVGHFFSMAMEDMLARRLLGTLAKVIVDTERTRDHLAKTYGPLTRLPEVVPLSTGHIAAIRAEPVDHLGLPQRFMIYPANHSSHKNHEALLVALAQVKERRPDAFMPLVLTGGGTPSIETGVDYRGAYLKALVAHLGLEIGKDLIILGVLTDGQFRSVLDRAAALVFPTLLEGFGFPPLEAGLLGLPVALSDIPVMRENQNRLGLPALWFNPESPEQIAACLVRLAAEEPDLRRAARLAAATVTDITWAEVGARYLQAFRDQSQVASMIDLYGR